MDLRNASDAELIERNIALGAEKDRIMESRRLIGAELDRRDGIARAARGIVELPDELQAAALASADPELIERVGQLRLERDLPPAQTVEPEGVESGEEVGTPGGGGLLARWRN